MVGHDMITFGTFWHGTACGCCNKRCGMACYVKIWHVCHGIACLYA